MSRLHFEEARTEEQFAALSLIHALGWRTTYAGAIPADFMAREITDDRWSTLPPTTTAGSPHSGKI